MLAGALGLIAVALAVVVTMTPAPRAASVGTTRSSAAPTQPPAVSEPPEKPEAPAPAAPPKVDFVPTPAPVSTAALVPVPRVEPAKATASASALVMPSKVRAPQQAAREEPKRAGHSPAESLDLMEPY